MTPNPTLPKKKLTKRQLIGLTQLKLSKIQGINIESLEEIIRTVKYYDKHLAHDIIETIITRMTRLRCEISND